VLVFPLPLFSSQSRSAARQLTAAKPNNIMKQYRDMPAELRLHVASYLQSIDLVALARVDKAQIAIARELLYQSPEIGQRDQGHCILSFLRTVFARPELMQQVQSLSISFKRGTVPFRPNNNTDDAEELVAETIGSRTAKLDGSQYRTTRDELMKRLYKLIDSPEAYGEISFQRLKRWQTSAFYSGLIVLLPNLEELSLRSYPYSTDGTQSFSTHDKGFFALVMDGKANASICSRMKLKKIRCLAGHFEQNTVVQPGLESLYVGANSYVRLSRGFLSGTITPVLTSIELFLNADEILNSRREACCYQLFNLEPILPGLRRIKLLIEDMDSAKCENIPVRSYDFFGTLFDGLKLCTETLETLEILPANDDRTLNNDIYCAMPSLSRFVRLEKLVIPIRHAFDDLKTILQPTLRELTLLHPDAVRLSTLEHVTDHYTAHGKLRRFDLYCDPDDDVALSNGSWDAFKERRISVYVWAISDNRLLKGMPAT
jgi:hypothetical protein